MLVQGHHSSGTPRHYSQDDAPQLQLDGRCRCTPSLHPPYPRSWRSKQIGGAQVAGIKQLRGLVKRKFEPSHAASPSQTRLSKKVCRHRYKLPMIESKQASKKVTTAVNPEYTRKVPRGNSAIRAGVCKKGVRKRGVDDFYRA